MIISVRTPEVFLLLVWPLPRSLATTYGISFWFLFLRVLRCFSSPRSLPVTILFITGYMVLHHVGSPIRKSPDIMLICSSPRLIAACHVLLRLLMPRHSPCALISLNFQCSPLAWVSQFFVCLVIFLLMKRLFLPPFVLNCCFYHIVWKDQFSF